MEISLRYGRGHIQGSLPDTVERVDWIEPQKRVLDPVLLALAAPIASPRLQELVKPDQSVVIVTSDITRPCPSQLLLPPLLDELSRAGIQDEAIQVVFGIGSHRPHTVEEQVQLLGPEIARRVSYVDSDVNDVVALGRTSRGTMIEVFRPVVEADFRIALGNVEPHYFAGYSGGNKALVPGVCSLNTIRQNHALMVSPMATSCKLEGNPVREDIDEGTSLIGLDFILNVVLDNHHQILAAAAGHPLEAHRWACRVVDYLNVHPLLAPVDVVIVSPGGFPKDLNMYQAQKALDNAARAVREGGVIVWVAECSDGLGNETFEQWLVGSDSEEILARLREEFVLGGHKAAAIARVLQKATIILVSTLPQQTVESCGFLFASGLDDAVHKALALCTSEPVLVVLPQGVQPVLEVAT